MSDSQAASAMERMYEDTTVRDELVDDDAKILLQWGEAQIKKLAAKNLDDDAFETAYGNLTALMGRINRFVGKRHEADEAKLADLTARFVKVAEEAGTPVPPEKIAAFSATHAALDDAAAVKAMTALLFADGAASSETPAAPAQAQQNTPADADATQPSSPTLPKAPDEATTAQSSASPAQPSAPSAPFTPATTSDLSAQSTSAQLSEPSAPSKPSAPNDNAPEEKPETKSPLDNVIKWIQSQSSEGKE